MLIGSHEIFQGPALDIVFFLLFFMNWFECKHFRYTLDEHLHLILLLSFIMSIYILNSRSSNLMFLGARARFQAFLLKNYFLVFFCLIVLNARILDLLVVNCFIWWFLFLFLLKFKFKEKSFRVYRGQWDISIILPKTSVLGFHCW